MEQLRSYLRRPRLSLSPSALLCSLYRFHAPSDGKGATERHETDERNWRRCGMGEGEEKGGNTWIAIASTSPSLFSLPLSVNSTALSFGPFKFWIDDTSSCAWLANCVGRKGL